MGCGVSGSEESQAFSSSESAPRMVPRILYSLIGGRRVPRQSEGENSLYQNAEIELKEMEERVISRIISGKSSGSGVKKTKAYETSLIETEFNEVKEKFWSNEVFKD